MKESCTTLSNRSSSRPVSFIIAETSHVYAFLSKQLVASSLPCAENDTDPMVSACWRGVRTDGLIVVEVP
jgi:hypothetical protein